MLKVTHLSGFGGRLSATPPTIIFGSTLAVEFPTDPGTFTGLSFGTAAADRLIVAAISHNGSTHVSAVTIGGISATLVVEEVGGSARVALWVAAVPTGTSGNVVVSGHTGGFPCGMAISTYAIYGAPSATASSIGTDNATIFDVTLTSLLNAVGIAVYSCVINTATMTWVGFTEQVDAIRVLAVTTDLHYSSAMGANLSANPTVTATPSASNVNAVMAAAAWNSA